jgi:outer membrane protein assembly factor BamB
MKPTTRMLLSLMAGLALAGQPVPLAAAESAPSAAAIRAAAPLPGGLFVHAGARDATVAMDLAKAGPWIGVLLAADSVSAETMRVAVAKAGLTGQVSVLSGLAAQGLPFAANSVSALIIENGYPAADAERLRVLRPDGVLFAAVGSVWRRGVKPRPKEMDDWPQWHGDATQNDGNQDTLVGQPRGLQWTAGSSIPNSFGVRTNGQVIVSQESGGTRGPNRLVGRDAFNGARLWEVELTLSSQYAFLVDGDRVYLHAESETPRPMVALDIRTGKQVASFDAGFAAKTLDMKGRPAKGEMPRQWPWPQALAIDGILVQRFGQDLYALDGASGKLLWKQTLTGDELFGYIAAADGLLVVSEGVGFGTANAYISGFSRMGIRRVVARQLRTGAVAWTRNWSGPKRENEPEVAHIAIGPGQVGIAAVQKATKDDKAPNGEPAKGWGYLVNLDLKTGKQNWIYEHMERYNGGWMALGLAGHSYFRTYFHGGRQWMVEFNRPRPYDPATGKLGTTEWAYSFRCHPGRTTPDLAIGSLFVSCFSDDRIYWSEAARAPCDVGTFPANGLLYQSANGCPCFAWLPNDNAFTSEAPPAPITANRLEKGAAVPAASAAGPWPVADSWPMHMRDSQRSNWTETALSASPAVAWTVKPGGGNSVSPMVASEWSAQLTKLGPLGSPSHAEGAIVLPLPDQQAVVCLDPKTGAQRWRAQVEGRVDSAPTLYRGLAIFGTRLGWVYALNRDTGALVWRFLAAPAARTILANGQPESAWPVFGTVAILNDTLWVAAGREVSIDEGYWWWALDPLTGAVRKQATTGFSGEWMRESTAPKDAKGRVDVTAGRFGSAATPLASDGQNLFMQKFGLDLATGNRIASGAGASWQADQPLYAQPGMYGFLYAGDHIPGGQSGVASWFASQPAKIFAWKGKQAIGLASGRSFTGGRPGYEGGSTVTMVEVLPAKDPKTGWVKPIWSVDLPKDTTRSRDANAIGVAGNAVVYVFGRTVFAVSLAEGKPLWNVALPSPGIFAGMSIAQGQITVACQDGSVVAIR